MSDTDLAPRQLSSRLRSPIVTGRVRTTVVALALVTATVCSFVAYALRPLADDILLNFAGIHELLARGSVFEVLSGWNFRPVGYRLWLTVEHAIVSPFTATGSRRYQLALHVVGGFVLLGASAVAAWGWRRARTSQPPIGDRLRSHRVHRPGLVVQERAAAGRGVRCCAHARRMGPRIGHANGSLCSAPGRSSAVRQGIDIPTRVRRARPRHHDPRSGQPDHPPFRDPHRSHRPRRRRPVAHRRSLGATRPPGVRRVSGLVPRLRPADDDEDPRQRVGLRHLSSGVVCRRDRNAVPPGRSAATAAPRSRRRLVGGVGVAGDRSQLVRVPLRRSDGSGIPRLGEIVAAPHVSCKHPTGESRQS